MDLEKLLSRCPLSVPLYINFKAFEPDHEMALLLMSIQDPVTLNERLFYFPRRLFIESSTAADIAVVIVQVESISY